MNWKMTKNRGGYTVGPFNTITSYTNYDNNFFWYDTCKKETTVINHAKSIIEYLGYNWNEAQKGLKISKSGKSFVIEIKM